MTWLFTRLISAAGELGLSDPLQYSCLGVFAGCVGAIDNPLRYERPTVIDADDYLATVVKILAVLPKQIARTVRASLPA